MHKELKDLQYYKFCLYGFFKNLRFFEAFFMLFLLDKGINYFQLGTLYAIREIGILILEIPTGIIADLLGRKKTMIASFIAYILSFTLFFLSTDYASLVIAIIAFSMGDALRTGTHKAMIFDYLKHNNWHNYKITYYGHTRSWSQIGSAISTLIATAIAFTTGNYKWIFLASTLPYIADLALIISYPSFLDGPIKMSTTNATRKIVLFKLQLRKSVWSKNNLILFSQLSTYQGIFKSSKDYIQPLIIVAFSGLISITENEIKDTSLAVGITYFVIYLISSFASRYSYFIAKLGSTPYQTLNASLMVGVLALMSSSISSIIGLDILAIILFVIIYITQNIRKPIGSAAIADSISPNILATGLSIQTQIDSLLTSIFAIIIGLLAETYSISTALITLSASILLISPILTLKTNN